MAESSQWLPFLTIILLMLVFFVIAVVIILYLSKRRSEGRTMIDAIVEPSEETQIGKKPSPMAGSGSWHPAPTSAEPDEEAEKDADVVDESLEAELIVCEEIAEPLIGADDVAPIEMAAPADNETELADALPARAQSGLDAELEKDELPALSSRSMAEATGALTFVETGDAVAAPEIETQAVDESASLSGENEALYDVAKRGSFVEDIVGAPPEFASDSPTDIVSPIAKPDNLRRIEGIGPKIAALLVDAGLLTFADLAAADIETLRGLLREARVGANPLTWPQQAMLAAEERWDELAELQKALVGGRRV